MLPYLGFSLWIVRGLFLNVLVTNIFSKIYFTLGHSCAVVFLVQTVIEATSFSHVRSDGISWLHGLRWMSKIIVSNYIFHCSPIREWGWESVCLKLSSWWFVACSFLVLHVLFLILHVSNVKKCGWNTVLVDIYLESCGYGGHGLEFKY